MNILFSFLDGRATKFNLVLFASTILSVSAMAAPTAITTAQVGPASVTFSSSTNLSSNPSPGHFGYAFPYLICPPEEGGCGGAFRADVTGTASGITVHDATPHPGLKHFASSLWEKMSKCFRPG